MRVVSTAAILWAVRIFTLTSSAVLSILTARALGPHGRGAYALPAIDASLATTFAAGLSSAAAYFMLAKQAGRSLVRSLAIVLVAFVGLGICATLATAAASRSLWAFVPSACFVVAYSAYSLACGFYLGLDRARSAAFLNAGAYLLTLCLVAVALAVDRSSPQLAIGGWVLGMAIAGFVGVVLALRESRQLTGALIGFRPVLHFAARAGFVNLVNLLNYRLDIFIVAIFASTSIVGLYTLAVTGAESVLSMTLALSVAALPRIGTLNTREAGVFTARCLRNGIFLAFVLAVLAFVSAPVLIRIVLGATYAPIVLPLRVLLVGLLAASTSSVIANYFMINRGRTHVPLVTSSISAAICGTISVLLVPRHGMLGAAIASTVAYIVSQAIAVYLFCRDSGVSPMAALFIDAQDFAFYGRLVRRLTLRFAH